MQGLKCFFQGFANLFNRIVICCKGKSKARAKKALQPQAQALMQVKQTEKKISDRKVIYVLTENHYVNIETEDLKEPLMKKAAQKEVIYAREGIERDEFEETQFINLYNKQKIPSIEVGYLWGVEDPCMQIFNNALDLNVCLNGLAMDETTIDIINGKKTDLLLAFVSPSAQKYLQHFFDKEGSYQNPIFLFLKKCRNDIMKQELQMKMITFSRAMHHYKWKLKDWLNFNFKVATFMRPQIEKLFPNKKDTIAKVFQLAGQDSLDEKQLETVMPLLHLELRNAPIAKSLINIHELTENIRKFSVSPLPLVTVLGEAHFSGVKEILENQGFTVLGKEAVKINRV